jgi:uncharacterized RDD family membrane protein YckC
MLESSQVAPVSRKIRLLSMLLDHAILCLVCIPPFFLLPTVGKGGFYVLLVPYLNKDFLQGRSPAKRLLGLHLHEATGVPANELRAFLRNVTFMLWPIEVLLLALGSQKRLGDCVAGTHVGVSTTAAGTRSWYQDLIAYRITPYTLYTLLATTLYLLLLHGFFTWIGF